MAPLFTWCLLQDAVKLLIDCQVDIPVSFTWCRHWLDPHAFFSNLLASKSCEEAWVLWQRRIPTQGTTFTHTETNWNLVHIVHYVFIVLQYLDGMFERDPKSGGQYHERQVDLYAKFEPNKLLAFLRSCNDIPLQRVFVVHTCYCMYSMWFVALARLFKCVNTTVALRKWCIY